MARIDMSKLGPIVESVKKHLADAGVDPKAYAKEAASQLREPLKAAWKGDEGDLDVRVLRYEKALSGTIDALNKATNQADVERLQRDLDAFLPSWRSSLEAEAASRQGGSIEKALGAVLDAAVGAGLLVARAYGVPVPEKIKPSELLQG